MKAIISFFILTFTMLSAEASSKYVLMMTPESSSEMPYKSVNKYCKKLVSKCAVQNSGTCSEHEYSGWVVPDKTDLDQFADKSKSNHFIWTKSRLFATGDMYPAVYRLSNGGTYGPSQGKSYRVRCVKWEKFNGDNPTS